MKTKGSLAVVLLFCALAALPLIAKTTLEFGPGLDFSRFHTFAFLGGVERLVLVEVNPELIEGRVHGAVSRGLSNKGLKEVLPEQHPDLVVRYWTNVSKAVNVNTMGNWGPYGSYIGSDWAWVYDRVSASSAKEGALVVDVIDAKAKTLVWRVYVVRTLTNVEKDWNKVDEEFKEAFTKYPPSEKEKDEKRKERAEHPAR